MVEVQNLRRIEAGTVEEATGQVPPWGWAVNTPPGMNVQLVPTWDWRPHYASQECPCRPVLDEDGLLVHNAFDGRERYEQGDALPH